MNAHKPWETEPTEKMFVHFNGYHCFMQRQNHGAWAAYVVVPPWTKLHGMDDTDTLTDFFDVHRGITWAGQRRHARDEWTIGFDCAHGSDYAPNLDFYRRNVLKQDKPYRDMAFVEREVRALALQIGAYNAEIPI